MLPDLRLCRHHAIEGWLRLWGGWVQHYHFHFVHTESSRNFNLGYAWIGTKVVLQDWKKRLDGGEVVRCCVYHRFLSNAHWERVCLCKIKLIKRNIQIERHWDRSSWAPQMHTRTGLDFNVSLVFVYDDSHYSRANIASSKAIGLFLISEVIKATSIIWHMHA